MPEREYYLDDSPKMKELRGKYEQHVGAMLALAGDARYSETKAKADAKKVLEIETKFATAWMTKEDRREPKKLNHRVARNELAKLVPDFPWEPWLDGAGAKGAPAFNIAQPDFVKALGEMISKMPVADWKVYLRWHVFAGAGYELPQRFVDEKFRWKAALVGSKKLPDRWKRCVREVDAGMGEALARPFVKKTLGAEGKAATQDLIQQIEASMHGDLEKVVWMDEVTRKAAFAKLTKVANKIAYPDKWRNYDTIGIKNDSWVANHYRASAFEFRRQLAKIGKPVDRTEWGMSPPTVNAYYDGQLNEMVFPAGILQPPFYANAAPQPMNFGGIGMVMGHELTHGFDDEGRQFDAEGNLRDWWSPSVNAEFERRADCVKRQFDGYTVLDDLHVNGKLTLGENIADLGGVKLSYRAMKAKAGADPNAEAQFFLGFAQSWCGRIRDEALRNQVATNPHSPAVYRVNGPLSNTPEFAATFGCLPTSKMVRKDRCEVW
jgi:endothelin-converting enzyme/putative endopeptidase